MEILQQTPQSPEQCKDLLKIVAKMLCVKAELISTRLLCLDDKKDMLSGEITIEHLLTHVPLWITSGMPDYANGKFEPYKEKLTLPMQTYRGGGESLTAKRFDAKNEDVRRYAGYKNKR